MLFQVKSIALHKILGSGILILISVLTLIIFLNYQVELKGSSDPGQSAFLQKREGFLLYNNLITDFKFFIHRTGA
jgi:hypothetical protein